MAPSGYEGKLLNLKQGVYFFCVRNGNEVRGKLFFLGTQKRHAKPTNNTATMLLYLLARDEGDGILYETLLGLVNQKFNNLEKATADVNNFLDSLQNLFPGTVGFHFVPKGRKKELVRFTPAFGVLDVMEAGDCKGTPDPDPMGLFDVTPNYPQMTWEKPIMRLNAKPPILTASHMYAVAEDGVNGGTIRR